MPAPKGRGLFLLRAPAAVSGGVVRSAPDPQAWMGQSRGVALAFFIQTLFLADGGMWWWIIGLAIRFPGVGNVGACSITFARDAMHAKSCFSRYARRRPSPEKAAS